MQNFRVNEDWPTGPFEDYTTFWSTGCGSLVMRTESAEDAARKYADEYGMGVRYLVMPGRAKQGPPQLFVINKNPNKILAG